LQHARHIQQIINQADIGALAFRSHSVANRCCGFGGIKFAGLQQLVSSPGIVAKERERQFMGEYSQEIRLLMLGFTRCASPGILFLAGGCPRVRVSSLIPIHDIRGPYCQRAQ